MRKSKFLIALLSTVAFWQFVAECDGEDWPQWLGTQRRPVWQETGILQSFPANGPPLRWAAPIGSGYSSPAISNGRVFVMDRIHDAKDLNDGKLLHDGKPPQNHNFLRRELPGKERVVCLRESDGKLVWEHDYECPYTTVAMYAIGPRCTPTVDEDRVYTLGAEGNLLCLRVTDGHVLWSRSFKNEYQFKIPEWGIAAHPLVDGDRLICMVGGRGTTCVAFNKFTGKEIWRAVSAEQPGYCPPMIYDIHGERQLVIWDSDAVRGLSPQSGEVFWSVPFKPTYAMSIGAPQLIDNSLFVMSYNRKSVLIRVSENRRSAHIAWTGKAKTGIDGVLNTAMIQDGHVYGCGNGGRYICADIETGKRVWETFQPSTGKRPAPWANVFTVKNNNRYFLANDLGELIIASLSPKGYEEISRAKLIAPTHHVSGRTLVWSHPSFANRSVFLRNDREIRCYSLAQQGKQD